LLNEHNWNHSEFGNEDIKVVIIRGDFVYSFFNNENYNIVTKMPKSFIKNNEPYNFSNRLFLGGTCK